MRNNTEENVRILIITEENEVYPHLYSHIYEETEETEEIICK